MSKIKKALERAKAQGIKISLEKGDSSQTEMVRPKKKEEAAAPRYQRTKIIHIPKDIFFRNKIVSIVGNNMVSNRFKLLRTRILKLTRSSGKNTLLISGFGANEGKSLISLNLAISMAMDTRQTTLLVDIDFRNPSIHRLLGLPDETPGLKQFLEGDVELSELLINPGIAKLTILPAGGTLDNATEAIGSAKMEALVKELKGRYPDRYILFDGPGVVTCPDSVVFSDYVDGVLLVARSNHTTLDSIKAAKNLIPKDKILGTVLNDFKGEDLPDYQQYYK